MYDVLAIANDLLQIAKARGKALTPQQVTKLTYLAQGWSLALRGRRLFPNRIEAWQYGPIIPDLYHATRSYGRSPIPASLIDDRQLVCNDVRRFLEGVFHRYGHLDGPDLSYITHQAGTPWAQMARSGCIGDEIPVGKIAQHFRQLAAEARTYDRAGQQQTSPA